MDKFIQVAFVLSIICISICSIDAAIDSCDDLLMKVEEMKWFQTKSEEVLLPTISCIICSEPDCDFNDKSCSKTSSTKSIPLYNNILEFGLVGNFLPLLAIAEVQINSDCYIKVEVTNKVEEKIISVKMFECLGEYCDEVRYEIVLDVTKEDKCVQVGLMFMEETKIYTGFSTSCTKVATAFYESSKYLEIKNDKCRFKDEANEMNVIFSFLQDDTRPFDGVPLLLPCNAGGYTVDPNTGRFWNRVDCWEPLIIQEPPVKDAGLEFVINEKFGGHEDYRFPFGQKGWTIDHIIPSYIDADGAPLSRDSVAAHQVPDDDSEGKERYGCALINARNASKRKR